MPFFFCSHFPLPIYHFPFPTSNFPLPSFHSHLPPPFTTPQAATRCCRIVFHAGSPAERQLFRTDFRFAPSPRRASLAGPPIHEDMVVHGLCGRVPDSAGNACSLNCCCSDRRKSFGPSAPIAYATSVSPPDEAIAWPGCRCWVQDEAVASQGAGVGWQMMLLVVRGRVPANHRAHFKNVNYL